jgi:hypothetical protein
LKIETCYFINEEEKHGMKTLLLIGVSVLLLGMAGCSFVGVSAEADMSRAAVSAGSAADDARVMNARYTATPVKIDGDLSDPVWQTATAYPLYLGKDRAADGTTIEEPGKVQFAWDDHWLYVAVTCTDSDVVAEGTEDEKHHYTMGDVAELFLKPGGNSCYWELYVTPRGNKSTLFFPGRGRFGLPGAIEYSSRLQVGAQVQGTLNDWKDTDTSWTGEMAIPIKDLTTYGDPFGPGSDWSVLVARYNYSKGLKLIGPELTMTPQLPETFFHLTDSHGKLNLVK